MKSLPGEAKTPQLWDMLCLYHIYYMSSQRPSESTCSSGAKHSPQMDWVMDALPCKSG